MLETPGTRAQEVDLLGQDFVFMGSGLYEWLPGGSMMELLSSCHKRYLRNDRFNGDVKPNAPRRSGKRAVAYCSFGGSHSGLNEATPTTRYLTRLLDHLGLEIVAEWHFVGEHHGKLKGLNTIGRMGDITGRLGAEDLRRISGLTRAILSV